MNVLADINIPVHEQEGPNAIGATCHLGADITDVECPEASVMA